MNILDHFKDIVSASHRQNLFVIECGACDGYHTDLLLSAIELTGKPFIYHAFEPNRDLTDQILDKMRPHLVNNRGTISLFVEAVGQTTDHVPFYKSSGQKRIKGEIVDNYYGSSSIRQPKAVREIYKEMEFEELVTPVTTLDGHLAVNNLTHKVIDFIWADIQGAEVDMIKGGKQAFERTRYLYTEYSNGEEYEGQIGLLGILELLQTFEIVEDYGSDVLLKNKQWT